MGAYGKFLVKWTHRIAAVMGSEQAKDKLLILEQGHTRF